MGFANQRWFDGVALMKAQGLSPSTALVGPDGKPIAWVSNGGILNPSQVQLDVGTRLFRFGRKGPAPLVAQGEWWLEGREFERLVSYADQNNTGIGAAVRLLCAVPIAWSGLETLVRVVTKQPLLAYGGAGAPASVRDAGTNSKEILDPARDTDLKLKQLYIPGLHDPWVSGAAVSLETSYEISPEEVRRGYVIRPF